MLKLPDLARAWLWRLGVLAACAAIAFLLGMARGERAAGERHTDYIATQAKQAARVAQAQSQVVVKTEVQYRDRIQTIYVKGKEIEHSAPAYVTPADDIRYGVNAGFVRSFNAAWANEPAGPAADADREPSPVPLADVAEAEAFNATACHAWREQALGLREFYTRMRIAEQRATAAGGE
jgi:hypothetical protein